VIIACTGVPNIVVEVTEHNAHNAVVCLTGVAESGDPVSVDIGGLNRNLVLQNDVVFGSVNANRRHYEQAAAALADADRSWLESMISRRVPMERNGDALTQHDDDVEVVLEL
jgi:glucose 1-dehydrogenase